MLLLCLAVSWPHLLAMNKDGVSEAGLEAESRKKVYLNKMCLRTHVKPQASWRQAPHPGPLMAEFVIRSM